MKFCHEFTDIDDAIHYALKLKKENEKLKECLERIRLDNRGMVFRGMIAAYLKELEAGKSE